MRFVPGGTSTAWPLIVSLGMRGGRAGRGRGDDPRARAVNQGFELPPELLDVGDVGPDGAVVKGADRRAGAPSRHVQDRVEVVLRSEEHTSELQSHSDLVCRLLL